MGGGGNELAETRDCRTDPITAPANHRRDLPDAALDKWGLIAPAAAAAFKILRSHWPGIADRWRAQIRGLGLQADQFDALTRVDVEALVQSLRPAGLREFRRAVLSLEDQLAAHGVRFDQALAAYTALQEICLTYLEFKKAQKSLRIPDFLRFLPAATVLLAAAFEERRKAEVGALATRLSQAEGRLQSASGSSLAEAYERERRQFSHDLHDDIGHDLMLLKLNLEVMALDLREQDAASIASKLDKAIALVTRTIGSVRRMVLDLGPAILDELGFVPAIRYYAQRFAENTGVEVTVQVARMPEQLPMSHQVALYRILQGALSNVLKHAQARNVIVTLGMMGRSVLVMVIQDDGIGFDPKSPRPRTSVGITAMRQRVETLGGKFHIESSQRGPRGRRRGTRIEVDLPLPEENASR